MEDAKKLIERRLTVTKVVFEFTYRIKISIIIKINSSKSCFK